MKMKSGYAKSEKKSAPMPEKRPDGLSRDMVNMFNAAAQGKAYQPKPKKK